MSRNAKITASLGLDTREWKRELNKGKDQLRQFSAQMRESKLAGPSLDLGGFRAGMNNVLNRYQHLRAAVTDVGALAIRAAGAPAQYADLVDSLTAVTGSADEAAKALEVLASISEEQKLEFEPLAAAYEHLRALGYSARQTKDFIREMGNAIEYSGGQASQITELAASLAKVADKAGVSARAVGSMGQSMPFLRTILKEQFGSETGADIEKLKLSSEELFDGILRGLRQVETSKGGMLDAMSPEYLASINRLRTGRAALGISPLLTTLPDREPVAADPDGAAARVAEFRRRAAEEEASKARSAAELKRTAGEEELAREQEKLDLQVAIERAAAAHDQEKKEALEEQLAILETAAGMAKEMGISEERATGFIRQQLDARREIQRLQNEAARKEEKGREAVDRLRSRGRDRAADKLEEKQTKDARVKELMDRDRIPQKQAEAQAEAESRTRADAAFRQKTGRNRIRGAQSRNTVSGLDEFPRVRDSAMRPETPVLDSDPFTQRRMRPQTPTPQEIKAFQPPAASDGRRNANDKPSGGIGADAAAAIRDMKTALLSKLEELKNANAAPVADGLKPVNG